jgi:solute carrier family 50 protein (sugar transporter)
MVYAIMTQDYYLFLANFPGFVLGLFYSISSLVLLSQEKSTSDATVYFRLESMLVFGSAYYGLIAMYVGITMDKSDEEFGKSIFAWSGIICAITYYAAPCTAVADIIRTQNSSSLHAPMILANAANASLWLIYGYFALDDAYVYGPNLVGVSFAIFQLVLIGMYVNVPSKVLHDNPFHIEEKSAFV